MINLLRRAVLQGDAGSNVLNWILPKTQGSTQGILVASLTLPSVGGISTLMEFDIKLNQSSHSSVLGMASSATTNMGLLIDDVDEFRLRTNTYIVPGLDLYDGEFHHFRIEKITSSNMEVTVDSFTPISQAQSLDIALDTIGGIVNFTGTSLDGIIKNFQFTNSSAVMTHDLPIDDGVGASDIVNNGTTANGVINGIEDTDYEWQ